MNIRKLIDNHMVLILEILSMEKAFNLLIHSVNSCLLMVLEVLSSFSITKIILFKGQCPFFMCINLTCMLLSQTHSGRPYYLILEICIILLIVWVTTASILASNLHRSSSVISLGSYFYINLSLVLHAD
jgi:hypothetical protein